MKELLTISAWQCLIDESREFSSTVRSIRTKAVQDAVLAYGIQANAGAAMRAYDVAAALYEDSYLSAAPITNDDRCRTILQCLGGPYTNNNVSDLRKRLEASHHSSGIVLKNGALRFLEALDQRYRVVVLSDTWMTPGRYIKHLFTRSGAGRYVSDYYFSDETGAYKVDGSAFSFVFDQLKADPNRSVHVGDLWKSDVEAASDAGVGLVIHVDHPNHPVAEAKDRRAMEGTFLVKSFDEALEYLLRR